MIRVDRTDLSPPWGGHTLPADEDLQLSVGPLHLRARLSRSEIHLTHVSGDWARPDPPDGVGGSLEADGREEPEWSRWPLPGPVEGISLVPAFPDRPLVVAPESSFRLLPGASATIYVRVPLWVAVELTGGEGNRLIELPTVILSETWWGSFTEGELCYWLPTSAHRSVEPEAFSRYQVLCPLVLTNRAEDELRVEKIALRVEHLSVFAEDGRFWSDETRVKYRGEESGSEIDVTGRPPRDAPDAARVSPPRIPPPSRAIHTRTFARLKALSRMGGD